MSEPVKTEVDDKPWLNKEAVIGGVVGAIFGAAIEYVFIGQGATIVAALLFGVAGVFVPLLFR